MLKVFIREAKIGATLAKYPQVYLNRRQTAAVQESSTARVGAVDWATSMLWFTKNDLDLHQNTSQVVNVVDIEKSKGNYVADADGNRMLDLCSAELNPLGYNHALFQNLLSAAETDAAVINSFSAGASASVGFLDLVKNTMDPMAPARDLGVTLVDSQNATTAAVKDAILQRSGTDHGWSALYFDGSSHGSPLTLGGMICGWPKASYPSAADEESQILEQVRATLGEKRETSSPIAAVVIEPTQQSTGYVASDNFISTLKSIAEDFEAALVIDETNTGCGASGKGFWQYQGPAADYVAFGKRTQVAGYFSQSPTINLGGCENDVRLLKAIHQGIQDDGLLEKVSQVSKVVAQRAQSLSVSGVTAARTSGTSLWLETDSAATCTKLIAHMRNQGVLVQQNGATGVVAKPALIFGEAQAAELFTALSKFK